MSQQENVRAFDDSDELKRFDENNPGFSGKLVLETSRDDDRIPSPVEFPEDEWVSKNPDVSKKAIAPESRPHQVLGILIENGALEGGLTNKQIAKLSNDETLNSTRAGAGSHPLAINGFADRAKVDGEFYYRVCEKGIDRYKQLDEHPAEVESGDVLSY